MTGETRTIVKRLVDRRVRELTADLDIPTCTECGAEYASCSRSCRTCLSRRYNRSRYGPVSA